MERHSFRKVLGESPEILRNCVFPQNFHTWKSGEVTVFFAVSAFKGSYSHVFSKEGTLKACWNSLQNLRLALVMFAA